MSDRWSPRLFLRLGFLVAAIGFGIWAVIRERHPLVDAFSRASWGWVVASYLVGLVAVSLGVFPWRTLLAGLGSPLPIRAAAHVIFVGQLGKYLPGSVWQVVAQTELAREYDVPRKRSFAATMLGIVVSVISGLTLAAVVLPVASPRTLHHYWWVLLAVPLLILALYPPVLSAVFDAALRLMRREPLGERVSGRVMFRAAAMQTLTWCVYGLHAWCLLLGFGVAAGPGLLVAIGAIPFAFSAGVLFIPAPAGAVVRETILVLALSGRLDVAAALAVALLSRVVLTACDFTLGLASGLLHSSTPRAVAPRA